MNMSWVGSQYLSLSGNRDCGDGNKDYGVYTTWIFTPMKIYVIFSSNAQSFQADLRFDLYCRLIIE